MVRKSRREKRAVRQEYENEYGFAGPSSLPGFLANTGLGVAGIALLVLGSHWLVMAAVTTARYLGVSELVIGLTIVAFGTSLPELAASVVAALRGERDIAVGNVIGSNLFNLLSVLGLSALVAPAGIPVPAQARNFDIPVMIAVAVACLPIFFVNYRISRWNGALFLGYYIAYLADLLLTATNHAGRHGFRQAMLWFIIPLTVITLAIVTVRAVRYGNSARHS